VVQCAIAQRLCLDWRKFGFEVNVQHPCRR
jgi:hypothetical protein